MITVRFPSGVALTYNDLKFVSHGDEAEIVLSDTDPAKGGKKKVFIQKSAGVLVELVPPFVVRAAPIATLKTALEVVLADLLNGNNHGWEERKLLADVKSHLRRFNAKKKEWR